MPSSPFAAGLPFAICTSSSHNGLAISWRSTAIKVAASAWRELLPGSYTTEQAAMTEMAFFASWKAILAHDISVAFWSSSPSAVAPGEAPHSAIVNVAKAIALCKAMVFQTAARGFSHAATLSSPLQR